MFNRRFFIGGVFGGILSSAITPFIKFGKSDESVYKIIFRQTFKNKKLNVYIPKGQIYKIHDCKFVGPNSGLVVSGEGVIEVERCDFDDNKQCVVFKREFIDGDSFTSCRFTPLSSRGVVITAFSNFRIGKT